MQLCLCFHNGCAASNAAVGGCWEMLKVQAESAVQTEDFRGIVVRLWPIVLLPEARVSTPEAFCVSLTQLLNGPRALGMFPCIDNRRQGGDAVQPCPPHEQGEWLWQKVYNSKLVP